MAQANLEALGDFDLQTTKSQIGSGQIDSLLNSMLARCLRRESAGWGGGTSSPAPAHKTRSSSGISSGKARTHIPEHADQVELGFENLLPVNKRRALR